MAWEGGWQLRQLPIAAAVALATIGPAHAGWYLASQANGQLCVPLERSEVRMMRVARGLGVLSNPAEMLGWDRKLQRTLEPESAAQAPMQGHYVNTEAAFGVPGKAYWIGFKLPDLARPITLNVLFNSWQSCEKANAKAESDALP